jgi:hypothetical protein
MRKYDDRNTIAGQRRHLEEKNYRPPGQRHRRLPPKVDLLKARREAEIGGRSGHGQRRTQKQIKTHLAQRICRTNTPLILRACGDELRVELAGLRGSQAL